MNIQKLKDQLETANVGRKWTDYEEQLLIKSIREDKLIDDIAKEHKRTSGGIRSRLKVIAVRMIEIEGKTIEEVSNLLHMTPGEINKLKNKTSNTNKRETVLAVLQDIREILLRVEQNYIETPK
jgi:hypothetical protein